MLCVFTVFDFNFFFIRYSGTVVMIETVLQRGKGVVVLCFSFYLFSYNSCVRCIILIVESL